MKLLMAVLVIPFDRPVTVGYMSMLKLNHLVDGQRCTHVLSGSYSLVTHAARWVVRLSWGGLVSDR